MTFLTQNDFVKMEWNEYQNNIEKIYQDLNNFLEKNNLNIDYIVPVLRGGGIPAISLSYLLRTHKIISIQLKHDYKNKNIDIVSNSLSEIKEPEKPYTLLLVDGYHASGRTSYMAYDLIKNYLPNSSIIYVTLGRDVGYLENKRDFLFSCHAFLSNECGVIPKEESIKKGVLTKYTLFPWEILEDELQNMNDEIKYGA